MNKFINRESELAQLESQYAGNSGSLVVLMGVVVWARHLF
jgi:AAA+ ATPase superfamily predicted ATPase